MELSTFHELRTPAGSKALARAAELAPTDVSLLSCATALRAEFPAPLANAALETVLLRQRAASKFSRARSMFFTREALEQSSSEIVSRYRAERFRDYASVADLCCGIGGDTIALAATNEVIAVDADPLRLAMAQENVEAHGYADRVKFLLGDVLSLDLSDCDAYFADPNRRSDGKRHVSIKRYQPPLDRLLERLPVDCALGVKIAPAVPHGEIDPLGSEAEFISVDGELKECVLWFGPLRTTGRRATLLPGRHAIFAERGLDCGVGNPKTYLYDPDPAVVRSGLVTLLGHMLSAKLIDPQIAFLTSNNLQATPFATAYRIDEWHSFSLKLLSKRLHALRVGRITIVKRGSAVDPELLTRRCKLDGPEHRVVILTRADGNPVMLIGERVSP
jgi:SAM-dependent methyltransferase